MIEYIIGIYILCGILAYGYTVGYFQGEFPRISKDELWDDRRKGTTMVMFGPIGLFVVLTQNDNKHGMQW